MDFPAVRESFKAQFNAKLFANMQSDKELADDPIAKFGAALLPAIVNNMVDAYITPDSIAAIVRNGRASSTSSGDQPTTISERDDERRVETHSHWHSLDLFEITIRPEGEPEPARLFFERRGFARWVLVRIEIPMSDDAHTG